LFKGLCFQLCGGITFNMGVLLIPSKTKSLFAA
jgi:hypothetical protein